MKTMPITERMEISDAVARRGIVEARINVPGELDVYEKDPEQSMLYRLFTIPAPSGITDQDELLEYARNNMPEHITFGFSIS